MAVHRLPLTALLLFSSLPALLGQDLDDALQRLGQRVGHRPLSISWQNQSTMPPEEAEAVRKRVEGLFEIASGGLEIRATLSENPKGYLIVFQTGDGKVYIESWSTPPSKPVQPPFTLKRTQLGESPRPILDVAMSPDRKTTVLLESFRIASPDGRSAGLGLPRP